MRTTIDIPSALFNQVLRLSQKKTKRSAIIEALQTYIRQKRKGALLASEGHIPLEIDIRKLRQNRDLG